MVASELKRIYQNTLIRWVFLCLLIGFILLTANIFYGKENISYKNELKQRDHLELIQDSYLSSQIEAYTSYQNDVEDKIESNDAKLMMSVFDDEVIRAQLEAENQTLNKIQADNVQLLPGYAITQFLESSLFSIFILVLVCILVYALFFEDMICQTINLYKSTPHSLTKLFVIKLVVYIFMILLFTLLCVSLVILLSIWDGLDLRAPIQWLVDYRFSIYLLTIFQQIIILMISQAGAALLFGLLILMFVTSFKNLSLGYGVALLVLLVEFFLYSFTSMTSPITALKYINLFYFLFGTINHLRWVTLANIMFDFILISLIVGLTTTFVMALISLRSYSHLSTGFSDHKGKGYQIHSTNLVWHELLRTLIFSKAFLVILLVIFYSLNRYMSYSVSKSQGQLDYEMIESRYYGVLNEEAIERITVEIEQAELARDELELHFNDDQNALSQNEYQELDLKARPYPTLIVIKEKMSQLLASGAGYFIDDGGYDFILESKSHFSVMIHFILITISLSLIVAMNVHSEYQKKLTQLYASTKRGHHNKQRIDLMLYCGMAVVLTLIVYGLFILKIQNGYVVFNQNLPLLTLTTATSSSISLLNYTLLSFVFHLIVYFTIIRIVVILSRKYDVAVVVVIMLIFAFVQVAIFNFLPVLSILHLLTISLVNQVWVSLVWVIVLIVLNVLCKIIENTFNEN